MRADLALVGFGHVGRRFASLIEERRGQLLQDHHLDCRVVGIATARHGAVFGLEGLDTAAAAADTLAGRTLRGPTHCTSAFDLIARLASSNADLRVVVETTTLTIQDAQPAIAHVEAGIDAGCHVVTANKGPVAFAHRRLRDRALDAGVCFFFEGAVMDGVPIFNLARETLPAVSCLGFRGIVNSTTNHILTMLEDGDGFEPALARMQSEGIAEADPSLDVDGWDAAAKTAALVNVLMHGDITPHDVSRTGIGPWSAAPARDARARGRRLRLVAQAHRSGSGSISARVEPAELAEDDLLAHVRGTANVLILQTDLLGDVAIHQLGGGLTTTAYALLADLIAVRRNVG
jgi:homoserine dehydrogenase